MAGNFYSNPNPQYLDSNGDPLSGGKLEFFEAGSTTTDQDTFTDEDLTPGNENPNPVILDSSGRSPTAIFLQQKSYNVRLLTSADVVVWPRDNVSNITQIDVTGVASVDTLAALILVSISGLTATAIRHVKGRLTSGDGYEGDFNLLTTDQSANVTIDTEQGVFVAPSSDVTGASGAWKRASTDTLTPRMFGCIADGDGAGGGTDDSVAMQAFLDYLRIKGLPGFGEGLPYRCDSGLSMLSATTSTEDFIIDWGGSLVDQTNLGTSGSGLKLGATSQANGHDKERINFSNLVFLGPETQNPFSGTGIQDGSTVGLELDFALNISMDNVQFRRYFKGITTKFTFPFRASSFISRENYIGWEAQDDSTRTIGIDVEFIECRYGYLALPSSSNVTNQIFLSPRFESVFVAIILDPSTTGVKINSCQFLNVYVEDLTNDFMQEGIAFAGYAATPVRGADRAGATLNTVVTPGLVEGVAFSGTRAAFVWASTGNAFSGHYSYPVTNTATDDFLACVNRPLKAWWSPELDLFIGIGQDLKPSWGPGDGGAAFPGATPSAPTLLWGNVSGVTFNGTGDYTISYHEDYSATNGVVLTGSCIAGDVHLKATGSSVSQTVIQTFDKGATTAIFDPTTVFVQVKGGLG